MKHPIANTRSAALVGGLALSAALAGCDDVLLVDVSCPPPPAPLAVTSVTADEEVILYWLVPEEAAVEEFVVYRSASAYGSYVEIGHTHDLQFSDLTVRNGQTYFYAVTAVDPCGQESELSREIVHDTPRPEGYDARIHDAAGPNAVFSGWDLSAYRTRPWDHPDTDFYFVSGEDGVRLFVAADLRTDIQDAGYAGFDDVTWAPVEGWSPTGTVEVITGHVYVVWTRDNHFAKVRVTGQDGGSVRFDWAYQVAPDNPELLRVHPRDTSSAERSAS
jgi:hypothetical protein